MKIKNFLLAGLVGFSISTAVAKKAELKSKKECSKCAVFLTAAKKVAVMVGAGSLSMYVGGVAIDALKMVHPIKHEAFKDFPGKVAFPILGALGVWIWCKCTNGDCEVKESTGNLMVGLPTKTDSKDAEASLPPCLGNCC